MLDQVTELKKTNFFQNKDKMVFGLTSWGDFHTTFFKWTFLSQHLKFDNIMRRSNCIQQEMNTSVVNNVRSTKV